MLVSVQALGVAVIPLNMIVFAPCAAPKFVPATVTASPMCALPGVTAVTAGGGITVNGRLLLGTLNTCTTTLPDVAPAGTGVVMLVSLQAVGAAFALGAPVKRRRKKTAVAATTRKKTVTRRRRKAT